MNLNLREQLLIINALYMMEGEDLHHEMESELGGTPDPNEVRALKDKIAALPIHVPLYDLPGHLCNAIGYYQWDVWEDDAWEYTVGESEDDSVIGSWIGYSLVQEIDTWLTAQGINYALFTE